MSYAMGKNLTYVNRRISCFGFHIYIFYASFECMLCEYSRHNIFMIALFGKNNTAVTDGGCYLVSSVCINFLFRKQLMIREKEATNLSEANLEISGRFFLGFGELDDRDQLAA